MSACGEREVWEEELGGKEDDEEVWCCVMDGGAEGEDGEVGVEEVL
jgi:hypothetical protein